MHLGLSNACTTSSSLRSQLLFQTRVQPPLNRIHVLSGYYPCITVLPTTTERQVFCHDAVHIHGVDASLFQVVGESHEIRCSVEFSSLRQSTRPCEDGCDRVRRCLIALLIFAVMTGYSAMGRF